MTFSRITRRPGTGAASLREPGRREKAKSSRFSWRFAGLCFALAFIALPARASDPAVLEGTLKGANYTISRPVDWNGGLVLFAHGSQDEGPGAGTISPEPLAAHLARGNYAWAASGFRATGYHPDWFLDDTLAL